MAQQPAAPPEEKQKQKYYNREEEYTSAQRSAVEAVHVGRETLETSVRQGEQLQNAETYADDTEYKLDRATRLLKGMTWSGWLANKFEKLVPPPDYNHHHQQSAEEEEEEGKKTDTPKVYEDVPKVCSAAAQQIQNYHANLQVLEECETEEQRATCKLICDNMYQRASKEVQALQQQLQRDTIENGDAKEFALHLYSDLNALRRCQLKIQRHARGLSTTLNDSSASQNPEREELFQGATKKSVVEQQQQQQSSPVNVDASVDSQQEEHLDFMADHLDELGSLASNLNESLQRQFHTLDSLDEKSESMLFKSKMVTRRADRLVQKKSWSKVQPEFVNNYSIRHIPTGKYLAVSATNKSNARLILTDRYNETCIFGVWKKKHIFGLQSKYSRKWAGQNLLGTIVCSANSFDRREEWDADNNDDWSETHLLCASAGWGNGGFLLVDTTTTTTKGGDEVVNVGGGGLEDKKEADLWCMKEHHEEQRVRSSKKASPKN